MSLVSPSAVKKKKKGFFGRRKSKEDVAPSIPGVQDEYASDSDDDNGLSAMAPGLHYTQSAPVDIGEPRGRSDTRATRNSVPSRSRSRSITRSLRRLIGGKKRDDDDDASRRKEKKKKKKKKDDTEAETPTVSEVDDESIGHKETPKVTNKKTPEKPIEDCIAEFDNALPNEAQDATDSSSDVYIEETIEEPKTKKKKQKGDGSVNDSVNPVENPEGGKKKKKKKKKKTKTNQEDEEVGSYPSSKQLSKKKGKKKGDKSKKKPKSNRSLSDIPMEFEIVQQSMKLKQQRVDIQKEIKKAVVQRDNRTNMIVEFKLQSTSRRAILEETIVEGGRNSLITDEPADILQDRRSSRSIESGGSSLKPSSALTEPESVEGPTEETSLAEALRQVAFLNEEVAAQRAVAARTQNELNEARREMSSIAEQNERLHVTLEMVEGDLATKEDRIESLEDVVEKQLDQVEFMEDELKKTEDELFAMEGELQELESRGILDDKSQHARGRLERVDSIRMSRTSRIESRKVYSKAEAVEEMVSSLDKSLHHKQRATELTSRERKVQEREKRMEGDHERDALREKRLNDWEAYLTAREKQLLELGSPPTSSDATEELRRYYEGARTQLEADVGELQRERDELHLLQAEAEQEIKRLSEAADNANRSMSEDEKDREIDLLRAECADLIAEKEELVRQHDEDDKQRDEDLRVIQEDVTVKMHDLEEETAELRRQITEAERTAANALEQQSQSETKKEIVTAGVTAGPSDDDALHKFQEEVAHQLAELDKENQKLNGRLVEDQQIYQEKLKEKENVVAELEELLEEAEKKLETSTTETTAEVEKRERLLGELSIARSLVQEKEKERDELRELLDQATQTLEARDNHALQEKDIMIQELQEQLLATRAVIEAKTSDHYSVMMKQEINSLKDTCKDLNNRVKREQQASKAKVREKEEEMKKLQRETNELKRTLERKAKQEKQREEPVGDDGVEVLRRQIEDLEDEIDHWKSVNIDLEDEVAVWKAEANEFKSAADQDKGEQDFDETSSLGSFTSLTSQHSQRSKSGAVDQQNSFSGVAKQDMFFAPETTEQPAEPTTPSQRAARTVAGLWSKMTMKQPPTSSTPNLYQLDLDD